MLLSLTVLVLGVLATACSELHADGGIVRELTEAIYRMEAKIEARIDLLMTDIEVLKTDFDQFKQQRDDVQMASDVSFSAYAAEGFQSPAAGDVISFPLVMTNQGGHYDSELSVFTCPFNGTYFFGFSLSTAGLSDGEYTSGMIQIDDEPLSESFCQKFGPDNVYSQCGNSVVTHCDQGQQAFLTTLNSNGQLFGYRKITTFSGFLISADTLNFD